MEKFVTSFSGGKDCTLAMYLIKERGFIPDSIIITVKETDSWTHGINLKMIEEYENVLGLKVYQVFCRMDNYEEEFENTLRRIKKERGVNICVFGDIDIEQHLNWNKTRCKNVGIECIMPLEKIDREEAVERFIDSGFKAIIKKVNLNYLNESFLGRELNRETIEDIKRYSEEKNIEIDLCGENGEYHTIVVDGPLFNKKLNYNLGEIKEEYQSAIIEVNIV
ncbi:diphthine--ammonia ligase [Peptacetobacter hiranonis]|uniref:Dph6-related ATP pyrophosphatase n=1 Tax=Peptacetobacter hiranonis TaxID=89152 RepID=UPI003D814F3E